MANLMVEIDFVMKEWNSRAINNKEAYLLISNLIKEYQNLTTLIP